MWELINVYSGSNKHKCIRICVNRSYWICHFNVITFLICTSLDMFWKRDHIIGLEKYIYSNIYFSIYLLISIKIPSGSFFHSFKESWLNKLMHQDWCKSNKYISTFKDLIHLHQRNEIISVTWETRRESRQAFGQAGAPNGGMNKDP